MVIVINCVLCYYWRWYCGETRLRRKQVWVDIRTALAGVSE